MTRSPQAEELWQVVYPKLSEEREGLVTAMLGRAEAQVLRLSLIYALLDGSAVVQPSHLHSALEVWGYCERSAAYIFGDATGNPIADRIVTELQQTGSISRTQVSELFGRHKDKERMDAPLSLLKRMERATFTRKATDGRSVETWQLK